MLGAYLVTFLVTRLITSMIRDGRGPFRDTTLGGVHVHHQVYGIFLLLGAGTAELTYRPGSPWVQVIAVLFGIGAALTLDEFALWLHLDDVYWSAEGRRSVDAVLVALVVGALLLIGANPLADSSEESAPAAALAIASNLLFAVIAIGKGRTLLGIIGVFIPLVALVAAMRLARPGSPWARRMYRPGSRRLARSSRRFPPGRRNRWDRIVDLFATPRSAPDEVPVPHRSGRTDS
ncbi:hypothetical protein HF519_02170 [Pseudonocardia bannensis]|uniref:Integral membrane protein n=2 Tax=Pseudonocardia bannensis TaxID=630973 RepID=A0A848DCT4_9PSEU|nr:hypothetical protein [Pseudonocardia bannensis]